MIPFKAPNTTSQPGGSTILDWILGKIEDSFNSLQRAVTNDVLVSAKLDVTSTPVSHGLGHRVRTWEVVDIDVAANVWQPVAVNSRASQVIFLQASAPCSVLIRFT